MFWIKSVKILRTLFILWFFCFFQLFSKMGWMISFNFVNRCNLKRWKFYILYFFSKKNCGLGIIAFEIFIERRVRVMLPRDLPAEFYLMLASLLFHGWTNSSHLNLSLNIYVRKFFFLLLVQSVLGEKVMLHVHQIFKLKLMSVFNSKKNQF